MNINNLALVVTSIAPFFFGFAKAQGESDQQLRDLMSFPIEDIMKAKALVDKYTPEGQLYLVDEAGQDWMKRAVSMISREYWLKTTNYWAGYGPETPAKKRVLYGAFDELKASAAKKLPKYLPKDSYFAFSDPEEEKLQRAAISDISSAKVFKIGTAQNQFTIVNGSNNIPINRYKQGYIWAKYPEDITGHVYCTVLQVNIIQNYAGGGTFGPAYGKLVGKELCGCPK